eukprot:gene16799-biopygen2083
MCGGMVRNRVAGECAGRQAARSPRRADTARSPRGADTSRSPRGADTRGADTYPFLLFGAAKLAAAAAAAGAGHWRTAAALSEGSGIAGRRGRFPEPVISIIPRGAVPRHQPAEPLWKWKDPIIKRLVGVAGTYPNSYQTTQLR